jgi:hypothetical protein
MCGNQQSRYLSGMEAKLKAVAFKVSYYLRVIEKLLKVSVKGNIKQKRAENEIPKRNRLSLNKI